MEYIYDYCSPIGNMLLASDGVSLTGAWFEGQRYFPCDLAVSAKRASLPIFADAGDWLCGYFAGEKREISFPLAPKGSPFRLKVWAELCAIPYGETVTYGAIAERLGAGASARAVGGAVGHNPISVFIPCHRVLGAGNALTGYAGGIGRKAFLLRLEAGSKG